VNVIDKSDSSTTDREIVQTRLLNAPRDLVWKVWTDPHHVAQWWGPNGFTNTIHEMAVKPGGTWLFDMHAPNGLNFANKIVFSEVEEPSRLVFTHGDPEDLSFFHVVATLENQGGKTLLTMRSIFPTPAQRNEVVEKFGAIEGGKQTINRLEAHLARIDGVFAPEFFITRLFDAPRDLVWQAWTDADRLAQWWGPKGFKMLHSKLDFRVGGTYHYGMETPDGSEMWGKWVFTEIKEPDLISIIISFSDRDGGQTRHPMAPNWPLEMLGVMTLIAVGDKTRLTCRTTAYNANAIETQTFDDGRDSMKVGFTGTWDQLETYLAKQRA